MTGKDESIIRVLAALDLPRRGWQVVDHWDADAHAIGIARHSDPRRLVYVSTFGRHDGRYDYECESPIGPKEVDYVGTDRAEDVTFEQLVAALGRHLGD
jgi:hypothetical protein